VVVQVLGLGGFAVLAAVAFEQPAFGQFVAGTLLSSSSKMPLSKPKCVPSAKAICGYCCCRRSTWP
jgi:hypothetical protein